jgi:hypothetical protein
MRKTLIPTLIVSLWFTAFVNAQELKVNGTVKDSNGNSVSLAFVQDKKNNTATRTDSTGKFSLVTTPNAKLYVSSTGYKPKVIDVKGKEDIAVILAADKNDNGAENKAPAPGTPNSFSDYTAGASGGMLYSSGVANALLPTFKYTEATHGSRYLFGDWVTGYVVSPEDSVYKNPKYGFSYDKMSGALLMTQDKTTAIEIDKSRIKSFTLYTPLNQPETFEYVPEIDKTHYPQVLESGKKYRIYKLTTTTFVKNNYRTDGMTSSGNNYDEYADEYTYFAYNVQTKQLLKFALKKKSIKAAFASDADKVNAFFESNDDKIDDAFLSKLSAYLDQ